ncbi:MAG: hypothetical protein JSV24_09065 [Bacteroidales bacterium]|nr:MAG: hypothetical protein JSV24_09065 [Bacteroidales bacterium]
MEEEKKEPVEEPKAEAPEQPQQEVAKKERPTFLTVLCILSFIGSGLSSLMFLIAVVAAGVIMDFLTGLPGMSELSAGGSGFFLVSLLLALGSLFGAILMWKLKKTGFYLYSASNILAIFVPVIFAAGGIAWFGVLITVVFIVLYGLNFKHME